MPRADPGKAEEEKKNEQKKKQTKTKRSFFFLVSSKVLDALAPVFCEDFGNDELFRTFSNPVSLWEFLTKPTFSFLSKPFGRQIG